MAASSRPNILFILTDQQRADTIAALGNPIIRTPNLDRLAREGVAFTSAYCPSPVCVSSRCSLYYGQYPHHTGCYDNNFDMPQDGRPTFMGALSAAGYRTHAIGKLHFTPDRDGLGGLQTRQSQEELLPSPDKDDYLRFLRGNGFDHLTDPHGVRGEMYYIPQPAQMPARLHPTQWIGDCSTGFLSQPARAEEPWMLIASFIHPHPPFAPPAPWHKLYRVPQMPHPHIPPDSASLLTFINRFQNRYKYRDQGIDKNLMRCIKAYYYACISFIDFQVGRMLATLQATGQLDNTLILFTSDHGELLGDYGCVGKRSMHDAAAKVPLLARYPAWFAPGLRCHRPASLVDVMPTMLAAANAEPPAGLDGVNLAELAQGDIKREGVVIQFNRSENGLYTLVTDRWKYTYSAPDQREFLFDRQNDPAETRSLAGSPSAVDAQRALRESLIRTLRQAGLHDAIEGENWRPWPKQELPGGPDTGLLRQDHKWADQQIPGYSSE